MAGTTEGTSGNVRVAAVQGCPVLLDREATLDLVDELTERAARQGAQLVVRHIARESGCFVIGVAPVMNPDWLPDTIPDIAPKPPVVLAS